MREKTTSGSSTWSQLAPLGGVLGVAMGLAGLAGWFLDVDALRQVRPDWAATRFNLALMMCATGVALVLQGTVRGPDSLRRLFAARALAASVAAFAALSLIGYLVGWSGLDQLLVEDHSPAAGQVAPNALAGILCVNAAMLLVDRPLRGLWPAPVLSAMAAAAAWLSIASYIFGVTSIVKLPRVPEVSFLGALGLFGLALGSAFLRPERGFIGTLTAPTRGGLIARRALPVVLILPILLLRFRGLVVEHDLLTSRVADACVVLVGTSVLTTIVLALSGRLNRSDASSQRSMAQLAELKAALDEHAIVSITDDRGVIQYVNDRYCAISQWSRDELIGQTHRKVSSRQHPASLFADLWSTILAGRTWHGELCNRARDGTLFWVESTIVSIRSGDGLNAFISIQSDVTPCKIVEERLRQSSASLEAANVALEGRVAERTRELARTAVFARAALDALPANIAVLDAEGVIMTTNRAWRDFAAQNGGQPESTAEGANYLGACAAAGKDDEVAAAAAALIANVIAGRVTHGTIEYPCHTPDKPRWFVCRVARFGDHDRARVIVAHDDVTQRVELDAVLRESEERHRLLFESSRDALMTLAPPDWQFTAGNRAALALFGAQELSAFVDHPMWQYSPEQQPDGRDSAAAAREAMAIAQRNGSHFFAWTFRRVSGELFPAEVLFTRVEIHGKVLLQATVRDRSHLQSLQTSLAQAERMASVGTLAAGVAHEINNPLAYVIANADFIAGELPQVMRILQTVDDAVAADAGRRLSELVEILADAREGAERIRNVVRDLKTFSRSDSDVAAPVAAQRVTEASINMAWNEIRHRARLVKSYRPVPPVLANESRLGQVVLNLLVNAAQALPEGRAADNEIRVSIDTDGHDVFIVVEDTGPGIAPEHLSRVFEPFFTTKPVGQGTGLGLSISRNIVQALGGDISVTSTVGRGTTFRVRLPAAPERIVAQEKTDASPAPGGSRCRILIVDDEPSVATALRRVVSNDHDVAIAGGGVAALERIEAGERFDVIFCDLMMPDMTGMELHAKLAASHKDAAERMIFVTGGAFSDGARAFLERTKNLYLEKPFDEQAIRALIRARQDSRSRGQEAVG